MRELILKLNQEGQITVIISSHILDELSRLATYYGFIDGGRMLREISAEDLDAACRKCIRIEVCDMNALSLTLDEIKLEYNVVSETQAHIFAQITVTELVLACLLYTSTKNGSASRR